MGVFFCDGCDRYLDSREDGFHETSYGGYECDMCESLNHKDFFESSVKDFLDKIILESIK